MKELDPEVDLRNALDDKIPEMRRKPRPGPGGVAHVKPDDTIAQDGCWCGRPQNHDWPGKDLGAPHPRYPD